MILVDNGININYHRIKDGLSPLQFAIRTGQFKLVKCILDIPNIDLNMKGIFSENDPANSKFYDG